MKKRAATPLAAFLCAIVVSVGASAQDLNISPGDFGIDPAAMPAPLPPPAQALGEPTGNFLTVGPASPVFAPAPVFAPLPVPIPGTDPLQTAAPDLYASLAVTVTATTTGMEGSSALPRQRRRRTPPAFPSTSTASPGRAAPSSTGTPPAPEPRTLSKPPASPA